MFAGQPSSSPEHQGGQLPGALAANLSLVRLCPPSLPMERPPALFPPVEEHWSAEHRTVKVTCLSHLPLRTADSAEGEQEMTFQTGSASSHRTV